MANATEDKSTEAGESGSRGRSPRKPSRAGERGKRGRNASTEGIDRLRGALAPQLQEQPYLVLGLAFGVGYVLAAGLPTMALSFLLRSGLRSGVARGLRSITQSVLDIEPSGE